MTYHYKTAFCRYEADAVMDLSSWWSTSAWYQMIKPIWAVSRVACSTDFSSSNFRLELRPVSTASFDELGETTKFETITQLQRPGPSFATKDRRHFKLPSGSCLLQWAFVDWNRISHLPSFDKFYQRFKGLRVQTPAIRNSSKRRVANYASLETCDPPKQTKVDSRSISGSRMRTWVD